MKTDSSPPGRERSGGEDTRKRLGKWAEVVKERRKTGERRGEDRKDGDREEERECVDIG